MEKTNDMLHFTISAAQATALIPVLEGEIAEIAVKHTEENNALRELAKPYQQKLKAVSELDTMLKEKKAFLESIVGKVGKKEVNRVMRATSHTNALGSSQGAIRWGAEFVNILKAEKKFLTMEELLNAFLDRNPNITRQSIAQKIYQVKNNFKESEKVVRQNLIDGKPNGGKLTPMLTYANVYWGLSDWCDVYSDGKIMPKPPFMKQFVYTKTA